MPLQVSFKNILVERNPYTVISFGRLGCALAWLGRLVIRAILIQRVSLVFPVRFAELSLLDAVAVEEEATLMSVRNVDLKVLRIRW